LLPTFKVLQHLKLSSEVIGGFPSRTRERAAVLV
jgi:hypothetical protein